MNLAIFKQNEITELLKDNNVSQLQIFGSSARNEETTESDIDLIVKFREQKSLLAFIHLENQLSNLLGKAVDLVTENSISPHLKNIVLNEAKTVYYEKR